MAKKSLLDRIQSKEAKIGIIGLGYVGLPLAVEFAKGGFSVIGIDLDEEKVRGINAGRSHIEDVESKVLKSLVKNGKITATTNYDDVTNCDVLQICVPTPLTPTKEPDISFILNATEEIAKRLHSDLLILLKSTTFPETTEKVVLPILEQKGLKVGKDFYLAFSPERIDPGNKKFTMKNTPVVVGGVTKQCTELAVCLYQVICDTVIPVSSPRIAEMTKLLENIFRCVNIALVNELARLCERMGNMDIWEVIEAASTKPYGFMPFYPGPGIGGHCIMVDPYYLSWKAREYDFHTNFIELAAETNEDMPYYVVGKVMEALSHVKVPPSEAKVLVLGAAFKRDVSDTRNSPAIKIMELIEGKVSQITYNDPYVKSIQVNGHSYNSVDLTESLLKNSDCVLIATDHSSYDPQWIGRHAKVVVDTRNAIKQIDNEKVIKLGKG
ncbi:nucleotide sugar dehydrogenase [candidate division TA06 bacterium]|nr:nucleotide sugar dehydrogenase [candidate division TA06 bacterium]